MAASRVASRSRHLLSSGLTPPRIGPSISPSARIEIQQRHFIASARARLNTIQTPSRGEEVCLTEDYAKPIRNPAASIVMTKLPRRVVKSEIQAVLQSKGYDVKKIQIHHDRFTFRNTGLAVVELGDAHQVSAAIGTIEALKRIITVRPVKADFQFKHSSREFGGNRFFMDEGNAAQEAARPLFEGRRKMLSVQTPGWCGEDTPAFLCISNALVIMERYFGKYGVEAISDPTLSHYPHKAKGSHPHLLCLMDFKTKEGADNAFEELNDTKIEARRILLDVPVPSPWIAHQIGKVSPTVLAQLQEKGLAPRETYESSIVKGEWRKKFYREEPIEP